MADECRRPSSPLTVVARQIMGKAVTTCQTCQVCLCTSVPGQSLRRLLSALPCAERMILAHTWNLQAGRDPPDDWLTGNQSSILFMLCRSSFHPVLPAASESGTDDSTTSSSSEDESTGDSEDSQLADYVDGILDEQEDIPDGFAPRAMEHLTMSPFHPM